MPRTILLVFALLGLPPVVADQTTLGVPDTTCQPPSNWSLHDYAPLFLGGGIANLRDGNTQPCAGGGLYDGDKEFAQGGAVLAAHSGDGSSYGSIACLDIVAHHPVGSTVTVTDAVVANASFTVATDASAAPPLAGPDCGDGLVEPCTVPSGASAGGPSPGAGMTAWTLSGQTCTPGDKAFACAGSCVTSFPAGANGAYLVFVGSGTTRGHVHL